MKTLLQTLFFFLLVTQICFAQWFWQNPLPQGNHLNSTYFVDSNIGWAVGVGGTILKTTDGGGSWVNQTSETNWFLYSVCFVDSNTGWAAGSQAGYGNPAVFKTIDGGANWVLSNGVFGPPGCFIYVYSTDSNHAWAVAGWPSGGIWLTTDGGETWNWGGDPGANLTSVYFHQDNRRRFKLGKPNK